MSREVEPRGIWAIPHCPECGEPVEATVNHKAYRHGFRRSVVKLVVGNNRSQEDGKPCPGSGKEVVYKPEEGY